MRITLSLNEDYVTPADRRKGDYGSSVELIREFQKRGHQVFVIHPTKLSQPNGIVCANHYKLNERYELILEEESSPIRGEVFFVRSLGEDAQDSQNSKGFISQLPRIEKQVVCCFNSAEATSYEYKPKQKTLTLPWIPQFRINSRHGLEELLMQGEKIIAKPAIGHLGIGIIYLDGKESAISIPEQRIGDYCFERFVPNRVERRFIFLDGELMIVRGLEKVGHPGKEDFGERWLVQGDVYPSEVEIVRKVVEMTGMFYGCVDFREDYVLEINGSGTTCGSKNLAGTQLYQLTPKVVNAVERKVDSKK